MTLASDDERAAEIRARHQRTLTVLTAIVSLLLLVLFYNVLFKTSPGSCQAHSAPTLTALAGDGKVTLKWELEGGVVAVKRWRHRQSTRGPSTVETVKLVDHLEGATNSHLVRDLMNGVTYEFRVQGILEADGSGCWSNPVLAVPGHLRNVVERIERRQQAIVGLMTADGKALRELGERGVGALEGLAKSTSAISEATAEIKKGVDRLANGIEPAVNATTDQSGIAVQTGAGGEQCEVGRGCRGPVVLHEPHESCEGTPLGEVLFAYDTPFIGESNRDALELILAQLSRRERGIVLAEGYASSAGFERHNMHLSDRRAICVSECLREGLPDDERFEFREIAKGEAVVTGDLLGMSAENQRVDVTFCGASLREPRWEAKGRIGPDAVECGCPLERS